MKKICFVLPVHSSHTIGGAQYQAECLMNFIIGLNRYHVYYITNLADLRFSSEKYRLVHIETNYQKKTSLSLLRSSKSLLHLLNEIKPDITYQRIASYQTAVCAYYARNNKCLSLFHIASDMDLTTFQFSKGKNFLFKFIDKKMQLYGIRNSKKIIAQTNCQAENLQRNFKKDADAVVYNFHPIPTGSSQKSKKIQILWVANVKKVKQPEIFMRLAGELHPETGADFIMIGKMQGTKFWRKQILQKIADTKGLTYLGEVSQETVNSVLDKSHVLVSTSKIEGFSNTFIQAWMRRVPVVSLHVDPDNLLQSKQIGKLSGDYEKLKHDVRELIEDGNVRDTLAQSAFNYSIKHHSLDNIQKIVDLI